MPLIQMMEMWFSGGMKRRLSVAVALIGRPKVVYLDEPSTGQMCDVKFKSLLPKMPHQARAVIPEYTQRQYDCHT